MIWDILSDAQNKIMTIFTHMKTCVWWSLYTISDVKGDNFQDYQIQCHIISYKSSHSGLKKKIECVKILNNVI